MRREGDELGSDLDPDPWKKFRIRQNDTQKVPPQIFFFFPVFWIQNIKVYTNILLITFFVKKILPMPKLGSLS